MQFSAGVGAYRLETSVTRKRRIRLRASGNQHVSVACLWRKLNKTAKLEQDVLVVKPGMNCVVEACICFRLRPAELALIWRGIGNADMRLDTFGTRR
jgi:hypothetical protein